MSAILSTEGLAIGYPGRLVAEHLSLDLHPGDVVALVGPNGTGKTTLLRTLAGLLSPLAGSIALEGEPLASLSAREKAQRLGVVLTERPQTGYLTGFELAAWAAIRINGAGKGRLADEDVAIVDEALALVGAAAFRDRPVASLSDGERQRVMVARALAQQPRLLLLDEVTSFMDVPRRVAFFALLGELGAQRGYAIVISTHELELALRCANRLWLYDGTKLLDGAPEDLILSGDFARIFAADGVSFDEDAGHFELRRPATRRVALEGEGVRAAWTRRALDRAGFAVDPAASIRLSVDATGWGIGAERADSIAAMLGRLDSL